MNAKVVVALALALPAADADGAPWLELPQDHAAHEEMPLEWWTFTGHVERAGGGWYAYQVVFHRVDVDTAVTADADHRWMFRSVYPASIALTDLTSGRFYSASTVDRDGAGTSRVSSDAAEIQYRAWSARHDGTAWTIVAAGDSLALELRLEPVKAPVAIGSDGIMTASEEQTLAWRYALPRLRTAGTIRAGRETFDVSGDSWMEHVYGHAFARNGEEGWDVLNLQLRDGAELSLYRFRSAPGRSERRTGGVYISAAGLVMRLETLTTRFYPVGANRWVSTETRRSYPMRWRAEIPALSIRLDVTCTPRHQELATYETHGAAFWRGSVEASGSRGDLRVSGAGFLELVGYAGPFPVDVSEATTMK